MSLNWLRSYADMIAGMAVNAVSMALDVALKNANLQSAARWVTDALNKGEVDLYLLRARYYGGSDFELRGFKLQYSS